MKSLGDLFRKRTVPESKTEQAAPIASSRDAKPEQAASITSSPDAKPVEPPNAPSQEELLTQIRSFPYWYQRIYVGHGVYTLEQPAYHERVWQRLQPVIPDNLGGKSVLDVGTNAGYFALEMKRRGAGTVLGIESVSDYLAQAKWCRQIWDLDIKYELIDAHNINQIQDTFDVVVFTGILYHLKNPLYVLEEVGRLCRDAVIVESEVILNDARNCVYVYQGPYGQAQPTVCRTGIMKFIEKYELNGDGSNWWVPDTECVLGMLRTAGFTHFSQPCYLGDRRLLLVASKNAESILNLQALH